MEQVTVEPTGNWSKLNDPGSDAAIGHSSRDPNTDEDLIEIKDTRVSSLKEEPRGTRLSIQNITPERSREQSAGSSGPRHSKSKRPASQVIDLTGSDEEDAPQRPPKRQSYNHPSRTPTQNGFHDERSANIPDVGISNPGSSNSSVPQSYYYL